MYICYYTSLNKNFVLVLPSCISKATKVQLPNNKNPVPFLSLTKKNDIHTKIIINQLNIWKKIYPQYILEPQNELTSDVKIVFQHVQYMEA